MKRDGELGYEASMYIANARYIIELLTFNLAIIAC